VEAAVSDDCVTCGQRLPHEHAADSGAACHFCRRLAEDELLRAAWDECENFPGANIARMSLVAAVTQ
jgi:hypothetical protein